jgi:hypothetical protein
VNPEVATDQSLTWAQFLTAVDDTLSLDKDRLSEGDEKVGWAKSAVKEIQELIPAYRAGHQSIYLAADTAPDGWGSRLVLPPGSVKKVNIVVIEKLKDEKTDHESRHAVTPLEFKELERLRHGQLDVSHGDGYIIVDPQSYTAWVYPQIRANMMVHIWWNGLKDDFNDGDKVPFDRFMAEAVAFYIRAEMRRGIEEEIQLFNAFRGDYLKRRLALHRMQQEKIPS